MFAKCPTCKAKGYTGTELSQSKQTYTISPDVNGETTIKYYYENKKIICNECKGTGVVLWIDKIIRKV